MGYRVKTVSAMTGIPRPTLLAWERRYDILSPDRSPSGYREYTDADVAVLQRLKALVDAGYSIGEAVDLARSPAPGVDPLQAIAGRREPALPDSRGEPAEALFQDHGLIVHAILGALLAFDRTAADRLLPGLGQVSYLVAIDHVFVPVLTALGEACERGEVSIAQEHFVSGFCREHLLAMFHGVGGGPEGGMTVACATPSGERHELGLLVLALKLALAGTRVVWLGAELPVEELCAYLTAQHPRFLCLSFTKPVDREALVGFAHALRAGTPVGTDIVFGGPGVAAHPGPVMDGVTVFTTIGAFEALLGRAARQPRRGGPGRESRASG